MLYARSRILTAAALLTIPRPSSSAFVACLSSSALSSSPYSNCLRNGQSLLRSNTKTTATRVTDNRYPSLLRRGVSSPLLLRSISVSISDAFDGGNAEFVETTTTSNNVPTVTVRIKPDPFSELEKTNHFQSFLFRATISDVTEPTTIRYVIDNAGDTSYSDAWEGFTTFFSETLNDPDSWERKLDTKFDKESGHLSWTHTQSKSGSVYFSYFPPYSYSRHLDLIEHCAASASPSCTVFSLGKTLDGREMDCVKVGTGSSICWINHRQHPGENMAEYYAEGLLNRLLGLHSNGSIDGTAKNALDMYTFYIVPNMNPDGAVRGHLRTNACGSNLNREWAPTGKPGDDDYYDAPTLERSPEVYAVLNKMDETGCDAFLDIHGDELIPYNFLAGGEGTVNWGPRLKGLHSAFLASYSRANSDMQAAYGYDPEEPLCGRTNVCSNQIGIRFDCFSATLEMPFKDCLPNSDPIRGWNPARARMLGGSVVDSLVYVHPHLRDKNDFWSMLSSEDAYVTPISKFDE